MLLCDVMRLSLVLLGLVLVGSWAYRPAGYPDPVVVSPSGRFQGSILTSLKGRRIFSFRGIRYAKAPVGDLRFKPPQAIYHYEALYNATNDGPMCPQPDFLGPQSEDCLFLNVYTSKLPFGNKKDLKPVIVHFHAGGFYSATGASYWAGPQYFMDQDIVLVTLNYRIGSLGFLSTGDELAPGNNGLKDQVIALKWIRKNIESFGGDPKSVTLLGYSAGAWSSILHMLSPLSRGLFHKVVAMSGSSLGIWPIPKHQFHLAQKQARILHCPDHNSSVIISCLKTKSAEELGNSFFQFAEFGFDPILIWSPVIEDEFGQERFLPEHPVKMIQNGELMDIPFMTGVTKDEFAGRAYPLIQNHTLLKMLDENFEKFAPISFIYERNTHKSKLVSKKAREYYLGNSPLSNSSFEQLANLYSDAIVGKSVNRAAKLISQANESPVYYYQFGFPGRYSHLHIPGTNETVPYGVVHHDDLIYLFYISRIFPYFNPEDPEYKMVEKLTGIMASFAKTGNPNSKHIELDNWEPFTLESQKYLDIKENFQLKDRMFEDRYEFWGKLYPLNEII